MTILCKAAFLCLIYMAELENYAILMLTVVGFVIGLWMWKLKHNKRTPHPVILFIEQCHKVSFVTVRGVHKPLTGYRFHNPYLETR